NVTASATTCGWTATDSATWITITSGASGTGNGTVSYSVTANTSATPRTGTLTIAGQTFTVNQAGVACTFTLSPTSVSPASGTSRSNATWITITSGSTGTGNGTVGYSVAANTGTGTRTGTMTIAGTAFSVVQSAPVTCTFTASPLTQAVGANGETAIVSVTASSSCSW